MGLQVNSSRNLGLGWKTMEQIKDRSIWLANKDRLEREQQNTHIGLGWKKSSNAKKEDLFGLKIKDRLES